MKQQEAGEAKATEKHPAGEHAELKILFLSLL